MPTRALGDPVTMAAQTLVVQWRRSCRSTTRSIPLIQSSVPDGAATGLWGGSDTDDI